MPAGIPWSCRRGRAAVIKYTASISLSLFASGTVIYAASKSAIFLVSGLSKCNQSQSRWRGMSVFGWCVEIMTDCTNGQPGAGIFVLYDGPAKLIPISPSMMMSELKRCSWLQRLFHACMFPSTALDIVKEMGVKPWFTIVVAPDSSIGSEMWWMKAPSSIKGKPVMSLMLAHGWPCVLVPGWWTMV